MRSALFSYFTKLLKIATTPTRCIVTESDLEIDIKTEFLDELTILKISSDEAVSIKRPRYRELMSDVEDAVWRSLVMSSCKTTLLEKYQNPVNPSHSLYQLSI